MNKINTSNIKEIVVNGVGCSLGDYIINDVLYDSNEFRKYLSISSGDGGLCPGKLVFASDLEQHFRKSLNSIIAEIIGNNKEHTFNAGGPSLVSLIHSAQLGYCMGFTVNIYGILGNDKTGKDLLTIINETPLNANNMLVSSDGDTPYTIVLSDSNFSNGEGERTFINHIGIANHYSFIELPTSFFDADIVCLGGTALLPKLHQNLSDILRLAKYKGCVTIVNTVYDFISEKTNPEIPWRLVSKIDDLKLIDVLIMDVEESLRISGETYVEKAAKFFCDNGVKSFFITNGAKDICIYSNGLFFKKKSLTTILIPENLKSDLSKRIDRGDTTGCGDNFAGGVIASIAKQLSQVKQGELNIMSAFTLGASSGSWTMQIVGGVFKESYYGEKYEMVEKFRSQYYTHLEK